MKIGNVEIVNNVFLAPMAGVTDLPFRIMCKKEGCGLTYSEMVCAKGIYHEDEKTNTLVDMDEIEKPYAVQIFGSDPDVMAEVVAELSENQNIDIIDINMGCPTPKIVKNGDGSALMRNPDLIGKIVRKTTDSSKKPITIKIRKGWDDNSINAVEIAQIAEHNGAKAITVHGRTREQFYSGKADWDIIKKVKLAINIPVTGNGDITSPEDAKRMFEHTNCDAVMIGRGSQGNPWIFKRVIEYLKSGQLLSEPNPQDKIDKIFEQYELMIKLKGEYTAVREMRKHIAWYLKGLYESAVVKEKINRIENAEEVKKILLEYKTSL